jgi:hypothetical protein
MPASCPLLPVVAIFAANPLRQIAFLGLTGLGLTGDLENASLAFEFPAASSSPSASPAALAVRPPICSFRCHARLVLAEMNRPDELAPPLSGDGVGARDVRPGQVVESAACRSPKGGRQESRLAVRGGMAARAIWNAAGRLNDLFAGHTIGSKR